MARSRMAHFVNTINNDEVKKSVVVFKLGRVFLMGIVKPRRRFGTPFFLTTAICLAEIYENYDRFFISFFEQFNFS